jgi:hypothetical protein
MTLGRGVPVNLRGIPCPRKLELAMKIDVRKPLHRGILLFLLLSAVSAAAQQSPVPAQDPAPPQGSSQNLQAISRTGLLPVYGVDVRLDPSWVDGDQFPSQSTNFPNLGTSAAFQQVWGALQPGGYSVLRVPVDVRDSAVSANRAANLCLWAKSRNVQLILLLTGEDSGQLIRADFPDKASDFLKALVALMRGNKGQYLTNYTQIMAFQIEDELNHAGHHGGMTESAAQQVAIAAAESVRRAELDALSGSGLAATPLMTTISFDSYLVSAGAIAGGTMTDAAYTKAYQALKQYFAGLAGSTDLDLLAVDWFAGSVGGGGVEKIPDLLTSLIADVPGKTLVLGTGFSTAFHSADEQKRFFTAAFANLSDFRARIGTNCPFVGAIFHEALNRSTLRPDDPRATAPLGFDKWDWSSKAAELTAMWKQQKKSPDMDWWLTRVENNMGLVALQSDSSGNVVAANALSAEQGMNQIAQAVSDANSRLATSAPAGPNGSSFIPPAAGNDNSPTGPDGQPIEQQSQPTPQPPGTAVDHNAAAPDSPNQAQPAPPDSSGAPTTNPYQQPDCAPLNDQGQQPNTDPIAQPPYDQQTAAACSLPATGDGSVQRPQASAQQGMMGLLNIALQLLSGAASGTGGDPFNGSGDSAFNNNWNGSNSTTPGSTYNYYNSTANSGQPGATISGGSALSLGTTAGTAPTTRAPVRPVTPPNFQIGNTILAAGPGSLPVSQTTSFGGNSASTSATTSPALSASTGPGAASSPPPATPPPAPAPVRAIVGGGTWVTTPSGVALPLRPGPGGAAGATATTGTNSPQPTTGAPIRPRPNGSSAPSNNRPLPCCVVTGFDPKTDLAAARETATDRIFQFKVPNAALRKTLHVGSAVYANFGNKQVSVNGEYPCCGIVSIAGGGARTPILK